MIPIEAALEKVSELDGFFRSCEETTSEIHEAAISCMCGAMLCVLEQSENIFDAVDSFQIQSVSGSICLSKACEYHFQEKEEAA